MKSWRTRQFNKLYAALPGEVQRQADEAYSMWKHDPHHPGLHFKKIDSIGPTVYSIRISARYRAIGNYEPNGDFLWQWIGSHEDYNTLV
jgi:hypothetical protein